MNLIVISFSLLASPSIPKKKVELEKWKPKKLWISDKNTNMPKSVSYHIILNAEETNF